MTDNGDTCPDPQYNTVQKSHSDDNKEVTGGA